MRLVDNRWAGYAKGVGIQRIIGRVHMVQIQIEKDFLTSSFSILEQQKMDMLLGLDMLKRHQVCSVSINLQAIILLWFLN
jgi:DNA damage-inducible protein 1